MNQATSQITRRDFAASLAGAAAARQTAPRLNLLLITNDQMRADCLGAAGNPVIRTPNMDRLAAEGVLFERFFVQCPQCVPSRSAIHTGRYPHVNRTPSNLYRLPDREQTLAHILNREGYLTAAVGEMPFAPTKFTGGFQKIWASDPEYHAFMKARGWEAKALEHRERLKTRFQAHPVPWPEEVDETVFFADRTIEFLKANRTRPFFLHLNWRRPHHPFDPPAPFDRMYEGAKFPPSHQRPGEMDNKPPAQRKALEGTAGFDLRTMTPADLDRIKSYYYGMISLNDKHLGRILTALDELGLAQNTIVVCCADHGEMLGDHGLLFKGGYFYDEVVRVPCLVRAPGKLPAGKRIKGLAEGIDLMPTLLELLGVAIPQAVQGRSLVPLVEGRETRPKRSVHAEFPTAKMIRTEDWKLVHYVRAPYGELYDLKNDPHELHNLYDDPGYIKQRAEMKSMLADWLVDSEDPALPPVKA
jgi:arylsulfatase